MVNTAVTLCGLPLENPVIPASGTFGYGYEFAQIYDINCLGTFSFKGTTLTPRYGNPTPRIAEYAGGLLNSVGLQNPGVEAVIREELPRLREVFHKPVMANVSGFSIEEYARIRLTSRCTTTNGTAIATVSTAKNSSMLLIIAAPAVGSRITRLRSNT